MSEFSYKKVVGGLSNGTLVFCVCLLVYIAVFPQTICRTELPQEVYSSDSDLSRKLAKELASKLARPTPGVKSDGSYNGKWTSLGYWTDVDGRIVSYEFLNSTSLQRVPIFQQSLKKPIQYGQENPNESNYVKKIVYFDPNSMSKYPLDFEGCEFSACAITTSLHDADVMVIDQLSLATRDVPPKFPNQIWLVVSNEAANIPDFDHIDWASLNNKVNWTWTTNSDSTWHYRHGHLQQRKLPDKDYKKIVQQKTGFVASVSNLEICRPPSLYNKWTKRLRGVVEADLFGRCGDYTCNTTKVMGNTKKVCYDMVTQKYKYYLSLEPSLCRDLVTDTLFDIFADVDAIPVVRGGIDYKQYLPPGTYVDASEFPSPELLADYLRELSEDEDRYIAMLKEKNRYVKAELPYRFSCELCKATHLQRPKHVYGDFQKWLQSPDNCWDPKDL